MKDFGEVKDNGVFLEIMLFLNCHHESVFIRLIYGILVLGLKLTHSCG